MIDKNEITILVRGKIEARTKKVLASIRKLFPSSPIVLSTWKDIDLTGLVYDILVENEDPGAKIFNAPDGLQPDRKGHVSFTKNNRHYHNKPKYNNVNRIIKTVQCGLEKIRTKYTLSIRTDIVLKNTNFLKYWDKFDSYNNKYKIFQHRIINNSNYAQFAHVMKDGIQLLPFHISDWIHFGLTSDIKLLYSCKLMDIDNSSQYWYKHERKQYDPFPDSGWQYPPETYVFYSLVKKIYKNIEFKNSDDYTPQNMSASNELIANNFIMVDQEDFKFEIEKYPILHKWSSEIYNGFITHREWQNLYKTYCDSTYEFLDIDIKRIRYYTNLINPIFFLKYPGKYFKLFGEMKYILNKKDLREKFYIGVIDEV